MLATTLHWDWSLWLEIVTGVFVAAVAARHVP